MTACAPIAFNAAAFRAQFSAFKDDACYPNDSLLGWWNIATLYISPVNYGWLNGAARQQALNLMTAHLAALNDMIANGETTSMIKGSTIDKISVELMTPPVTNQFGWWANLTSYGQQLYALLQIKSVGGMYVGGSAQRAAFMPAGRRFFPW